MKNLKFFSSILIIMIWSTTVIYPANFVKLTKPNNGWSTSRVITISGTASTSNDGAVTVVYNGIPLRLPLEGGAFSRDFVAAPGLNTIYAVTKAGDEVLTDSISFYSKAPAKALKIVLMWDTDNTDLDLHVIEPSGEECYYGYSKTKIGGALDVDVTNGYGPEVYTLAAPTPGVYTIKVHYYSDNGYPETEVHVYVVMNEGTANESVKVFESMLTQTGVEVVIDSVNLE